MTYRSILTYFDGDAGAPDRLKVAVDVTRQFDAHLTCLAFGYDPSIQPYAFGEASGALVANLVVESKAKVEERVREVDATLRPEGILADVEPVLCGYSEVSRHVGSYARFSDLMVLGPTYGDGVEVSATDALIGTLFDGDAAALVCPAGTTSIDAKTVAIAWNDSRQALRAVRRAMPFLKRAKAVEIVVIDPSPYEHEPGQRLATMLSRHDIHADISVIPRSSDPVSVSLGRRVVELGAGLLVMGAYGHSRFREYMFGGVTREILQGMPVPVLLAH